MIKKTIFYTSLTIIILIVGSGFKRYEFKHIPGFHIAQDSIYYATVPNMPEIELEPYEVKLVELPKSLQSFNQFRDKLAFKESQGRYNVVNRFGYMGKYQFGKSTLRIIGIKDTEAYLHNPKLQEKSFEALLSINKYILRNEIKKYENQNIGGVKITESGVLAAAHLGGAGSVLKFLSSNGANEFKDGNGTSVKKYLKMFADFDTSNIVAKRSVNLSHLEVNVSKEVLVEDAELETIENVMKKETSLNQ